MREPNNLLRAARLRLVSPSGSGRVLSRQELAEAVNAWLFEHTGRVTYVDAGLIGKWERGEHRWPAEDKRRALRAVLGAACDADLGLYIVRGWSGPVEVPVLETGGKQPMAAEAPAVDVVLSASGQLPALVLEEGGGRAQISEKQGGISDPGGFAVTLTITAGPSGAFRVVVDARTARQPEPDSSAVPLDRRVFSLAQARARRVMQIDQV